MNAWVGKEISRVDGPAKVTGQATYAAEFQLRNKAYAALVTATIPSGTIERLDVSAAEAAPGVILVLSHLNAPGLPYAQPKKRPVVDPQAGERLHVFQGPEVLFDGQPIAVVVAETKEQADSAAMLVSVDYRQTPPAGDMDPSRSHAPNEAVAKSGRPGEKGRGDAGPAYRGSAVTIDITCSHEREQHNAMEPHATIAEWDGDHLTLYDKSQWVDNVRQEIALIFGMAEDNVRVISPFVGGAFGSALRTWPHVTIAALAARQANRPVQLELSRRQCFFSAGARPKTLQRLRLGADHDGKLQAIIHEAIGQTSVYEDYAEITLDAANSLYACSNVATRYHLVKMNMNSPCPMRAPGTATGVFGLEIAMDEMAEECGLDPVEFRLRNHADRDEEKDLPYSSKELKACYALAAEAFGWSHRSTVPGRNRNDRWLIGHGMATAFYPSHRSSSTAKATMFANGTVVVRTAAGDMGPGTYTAMTQLAAETLDLTPEQVQFELGDTDMPEAPVHGGSITLASVGNAVIAACRSLREKLGNGDPVAAMRQLGQEAVSADAESKPGEEANIYSSSAFGAVFVEVAVDSRLGAVRIPRIVGAYDIGTVVNPKIARSQCIGGMVGGLGMALLEQAEWDPALCRVMNANLAEYLVPVNADVQHLDVLFAPGEDKIFNPIGSKGVAEIALTGVAPAIANAIYNATGHRLRNLPITPDKLLEVL
ncbi:MAG TPA: xanthine dehydrogenase family protein molybdopterin-binding subunit [Rhodopila sp.]|uniref:xanthine dehydrogenase family protein molybdopterin-binding subunit n=1 Tax=Rhodopila sp. TaxID=2480087 RepID=UPI002C6FC92C|nr:xanthine dehydrogenase family protein molybdopterin-binding subunit [Rhodopila sp.]HVY13972.1 xanthine dehydrogenase family protein molybdopterin-binding subunit [Rhodopila sp.]